jgi:hypothetical protein
MEGNQRVLGEFKATRRKQTKGNAAVPMRSFKIFRFRWHSLLVAQNQRTSSEGITEWARKEKSNGSNT